MVALEAYSLALGMFEVALIEVEVVLSLLPYDLIQVEQVQALVVLSLLLYDEIQVEQVEAYYVVEDIELEEDGSEDIGLVVDQVA